MHMIIGFWKRDFCYLRRRRQIWEWETESREKGGWECWNLGLEENMLFILVLEGGCGYVNCNLLGLMGRKCFFISKPNRFGSVRVVRFKHYKTGNRTEPDIFLNILIGFFSVRFFRLFFSRFLSLIGFLIFLLTLLQIHGFVFNSFSYFKIEMRK